MNIKTAFFSCAAALISFIAYPTGIVDTDGNAATDATDIGDIDTDATTLGDFRAYMVEYIESPETASATAYTGVSKDTALRDGKFILYHNKTQASGNWTLNLTLANGTTTGAKPVYVWGTTQVSTRYAANSVIPMVYRASANAWFVSDYDSNSNNYDRNLVTYCKAAAAIAANTIVCGTTNGYRQIAANVKFDLGLPILFCNAAQTAGKTNGNNWYSNLTGIDVRTTVSGFVSKRGQPLYLLGSVNGQEFTIASSNFLSYEPVKPCIPLGWFNANADNSFCFLPGPLMVDYATKSDLDAMGETKQDKLPYATNAIPYAAISGKPTNVSAFNNDAGYVTKSVTNGLLSTATAAATYATKTSVSSAAAASTNYTDTATTITEEMGEWVLSDSSVTYDGRTYPIYLYHFNPAPQYDYWALGQSVGSGNPFAYVPYNESATSLTFNFTSSFTPSVITATRSKYYVLGSQTDKPLQPAGDYAMASVVNSKLDTTNGVANKLVILTTPFSTLNTEPAVRFSITNGVSTLQVGTYNKTTKTFSVLGGYNLPKGHFGNIVTSTDISGMARLHDLAPECQNADHKAGELAVHNNVLMICEQDYTGAYDPSYFRAATVEEALAFIRGDLGNVWDSVHAVENDAAAAMREAEKKIDSSNGTAEGLIMLGGSGSETVRQGVMVTNDTIKIGTYDTSSKVFTPQKTFTLPSETGTLVTEGDVSEQLELYLGTNVIHRISANNMSLLWTGPYTGQTGLDILSFVSNGVPHEVSSYYLTWSGQKISASLTCTDGNFSIPASPVVDLSLYSVATTNTVRLVGENLTVNGVSTNIVTRRSSNAVDISGSRYGSIGYNSVLMGGDGYAEGEDSIVMGGYSRATKYATIAGGWCSAATNILSWVWNGDNDFNRYSYYSYPTKYYCSHGKGTFNLNPVGGLDGFYVGETNMTDHIKAVVLATPLNPEPDPADVSELAEYGTFGSVGAAILALIAAVAALKRGQRYSLVEKTPSLGHVQLDDRAVNTVNATGMVSIVLDFPEGTSGRARDFMMVIDCGATPPTLAYGSYITIYAEDDDALVPEEGRNIYMFTETSTNRFFAARKLVDKVVEQNAASPDQLMDALASAGIDTSTINNPGQMAAAVGLSGSTATFGQILGKV